ncbi:hypothetical protein HRG_014694 [Hirsutella rhossiliensis]
MTIEICYDAIVKWYPVLFQLSRGLADFEAPLVSLSLIFPFNRLVIPFLKALADPARGRSPVDRSWECAHINLRHRTSATALRHVDPLSPLFVLQDAITNGSPTPESIPKTVIFIDSRRDIQNCAECLRQWLQKLSAGAIGTRDCKQIIQVYHSHTTLNDKNALYDEFSKADSKIRIMVATESLGTGVDLSDVIRVVQYGFLSNASYNDQHQGEAIFLGRIDKSGNVVQQSDAIVFEKAFRNDRWTVTFPTMNQISLRAAQTQDRQRAPNRVVQLLPGAVQSCQSILMLTPNPHGLLPAPGPGECCNVCNPSLTRTLPFPWEIVPSLRKPHDGTASVLWGDNAVNSAHQMAKPKLSVRLFTRKSEWISLSTEYAYIHTAAELEEDHFDELFKEFNTGPAHLGWILPVILPSKGREAARGINPFVPQGKGSRSNRSSSGPLISECQ